MTPRRMLSRDHVIGFAERIRERRIPVWVREADAALARGEVPNPAKGARPVRPGPRPGFLWFALLCGGLRTPHLAEMATFGDDPVMEVPGAARGCAPSATPARSPGPVPAQSRSTRARVSSVRLRISGTKTTMITTNAIPGSSILVHR